MMLLQKFRIRNYKSIADSGDCYPEPTVTVLAGKNEAGKTSILEALADANADQTISSRAIPIRDPAAKPQIVLWFDVNRSDLVQILKEAGVDGAIDVPEHAILKITKTYPMDYRVECEELEKALAAYVENVKTPQAFQRLKNLDLQGLPAGVDLLLAKLGTENPALAIQKVETLRDTLASADKVSAESKAKITSRISEAVAILTDAIEESKLLSQNLASLALSFIPNFILFSSFDDVFPSTVPVAELTTNKWIQDLSIISDLNVATISGQDDRAKITHKTRLNLTLNQDFRQFWSQDETKLLIDWDLTNLRFWIEEESHFFEPEIRSQGRKWHLAFYVRVSARARENVRNIILIDEPGLYLHAKAQRDILGKLEEAGKECQVIFTTHSPYLFEPDKLDRVRLVVKKTNTETWIENKLHKVADKDTLTPVLTAIGLELSEGIANLDHVENVIVEGPSEYYYLTAFRLLNGTKNLNFVWGGGATNMPIVGTILHGWGCRTIYLYDNDRGAKDAEKNLRKKWITVTSELLVKLPIDGAIEDLFTRADFARFVAEIPVDQVTSVNSEYAKSKDKVLLARKFLQRVRSGQKMALSQEFRTHVKALMDQLASKMKDANP
jgi:hypothetical protein